jgi:diacylglycerol kinase family enzyme
MKTLAVINPRSAGGRTGREAEAIARRLADVSGPLSVALTSGPMDASRITTRAVLEGFERIVAVGGDGLHDPWQGRAPEPRRLGEGSRCEVDD